MIEEIRGWRTPTHPAEFVSPCCCPVSVRSRELVPALLEAVRGVGSLCRRPELWPVACKCPTTADPGILPGPRRDRDVPCDLFCVGRELPTAGNIPNELV